MCQDMCVTRMIKTNMYCHLRFLDYIFWHSNNNFNAISFHNLLLESTLMLLNLVCLCLNLFFFFCPLHYNICASSDHKFRSYKIDSESTYITFCCDFVYCDRLLNLLAGWKNNSADVFVILIMYNTFL